MNDYYLKEHSGSLPGPSSNTEDVKNFIKDKYVRKKWVDEDEEDPVALFQAGKWGKKRKGKKSKKGKKKRRREVSSDEEEKSSEEEPAPKKKKKRAKKPKKEDALIDMDDGDGFDDFVSAPDKEDDGFMEFESAKTPAHTAPSLFDLDSAPA